MPSEGLVVNKLIVKISLFGGHRFEIRCKGSAFSWGMPKSGQQRTVDIKK